MVAMWSAKWGYVVVVSAWAVGSVGWISTGPEVVDEPSMRVAADDKSHAQTCTFTVKVESIKVSEDQNESSGKDGTIPNMSSAPATMEVRVTNQVTFDGNQAKKSYPTTGSVALKEGASSAANQVLISKTVHKGESVRLEVVTRVEEIDTGEAVSVEDPNNQLAPNDTGELAWNYTFTCNANGGTGWSKSVSINENGRGTGKVTVSFDLDYKLGN